MISLIIHIFLIFGISITTYYKLPIFKESPIINVKFANSNQDFMTQTNAGDMNNLEKDLSSSIDGNISSSKNISQSFKIKKLQANSVVNSEEAVYLNLWQRQIETKGDKLISESKNLFDGKVQIMATIDIYGNLIDSKILISSGNQLIDDMAINILRESAPFAPFNKTMSNEYSVLEIIRDWNFSKN
jgi:protein TonB